MIKFLIDARNPKEYSERFTSTFVIGFVFISIVALLIVINGHLLGKLFSSPVVSSTLLYFLPQLPLWLVTACMRYVEQVKFKYFGTVYSAIIFNGLFVAFVIAVQFVGSDLTIKRLIYLQYAAAFASTLFIFVYNMKYLPVAMNWSLQTIKEIFNFTKYVAGSNLVFMLRKDIDTFLLGFVYGPNAIALYQTAFKFLQLFQIPNQTITQASYPRSVSLARSGGSRHLKDLYEKSVGRVILTSLPPVIILFIFADPIINWLGGYNYHQAADFLKILLIMALLLPFSFQFGTILDSIGRTRLNYRIAIISTFIIFLMVRGMMYIMDEFGAPVGLVISQFLVVVFCIYFLNKLIGVSMGGIFKGMLSDLNTAYQWIHKKIKSR